MNIRNHFFLIIFLIMFFACNFKSEKPNESKSIYVSPGEDIQCLLDSFINESGSKKKINEVYVDKQTLWDFDIIIYSGELSLCESIEPLVKINHRGVVFDLYSGLEHYFKTSSTNTTEINDFPRKEGPPDGIYWIIKERRNKNREIIKGLWATPFQSLLDTGVEFTPVPFDY